MNLREINKKINILYNREKSGLCCSQQNEINRLERLRDIMLKKSTKKVSFYTPDEFIIGGIIYTPGWYSFINIDNFFYFESALENISIEFINLPKFEPVINPDGGLVRWWSEAEVRESKLNELFGDQEVEGEKVFWYV